MPRKIKRVALTRNHGLNRVDTDQLGMTICFTEMPGISSSTGERLSATSTIETANPASTRAVASRITLASVRADPKMCMHTLVAECTTAPSRALGVAIRDDLF